MSLQEVSKITLHATSIAEELNRKHSALVSNCQPHSIRRCVFCLRLLKLSRGRGKDDRLWILHHTYRKEMKVTRQRDVYPNWPPMSGHTQVYLEFSGVIQLVSKWQWIHGSLHCYPLISIALPWWKILFLSPFDRLWPCALLQLEKICVGSNVYHQYTKTWK